MLDETTIRELAAKLDHAEKTRAQLRHFSAAYPEMTIEDGYAIQDAFVALRAAKLGPLAGYKIALSSPEMQRFVGVDAPQAGAILRSQLRRSPARVSAADYVHLIVEFEIAVEIGEDLPKADAPFGRERILRAVAAVMPAIEIADDRNADYSQLSRHPYELIADNGWNEGAVLGEPSREWRSLDLGQVLGVATINGRKAGEGRGEAALGHPLEAVAWLANHLASMDRGLLRGEVVITGSVITSKTAKAGDRIEFAVGGLGKVELTVE